MAYADLIEDVREALSISSQHDASILRGIKRTARLLLRNYNFRDSVRRSAAIPLSLGAYAFARPVGAGKIKAVRLRQLSGSTYLYKRLRRREEGQLPRATGSSEFTVSYWWHEPPYIRLDTPLPETGIDAEVWYQSVDIDFCEDFLTSEFSDVLFHQSVFELAPIKRKPEVSQAFAPLVQADVSILAVYLQELEFEDLEMRMGGDEPGATYERYPAN